MDHLLYKFSMVDPMSLVISLLTLSMSVSKNLVKPWA